MIRRLLLFCALILVIAAGTSAFSSSAPSDNNGDGLNDLWRGSARSPRAPIKPGFKTSDRAKSYRPVGTHQFTDSGIDIGAWSLASTVWGDHDGDGDLDLLIVGGCEGHTPVQTTKIFLNDGTGNLTEDTSQELIGVCGGVSSSDWIDIDKDGDLDLFFSGYDGTQYRGEICRNQGDGSYILDATQDLAELTSSAMDWGDCDNDGDLDLILAGTQTPYPYSCVTKLYRNDGTGHLVEDETQDLRGVAMCDVAWGDADSDGDLDLAISGCVGTLYDVITTIYRNDGTGHLEHSQSLVGLQASALSWGDVNDDGYLDLVASGNEAGGDLVSILYRNDGTGHLELDPSQILKPVYRSHLSWADYDNDGELDLGLMGYADSPFGGSSVLYYADHEGHLIEDAAQELVQAGYGSLAWGDYDSDGDLDLVLIGQEYLGKNEWRQVGFLYRNNASEVASPNHPPEAPQNLSGWVLDDRIELHWGDGFDIESDPRGLTYNLRVGSFPGGCDVYYAEMQMAVNNTVGFGRCWHTHEKLLPRVPGVEWYFWSVQTVDDGLARSSWAPERFLSADTRYPAIIASPGPGYSNQPLVRLFPPEQDANAVIEFTAYGYRQYGAHVSCGDVNADLRSEILTGAGPGEMYGPQVRGFQFDGTPLPGLSYLAYGTNKYGVNVAAGDIDGDGFDEIITGAGAGAVYGPHVRGWNFDGSGSITPMPGVSYFAYGTPKWGVNVSAGDVDGDGYDEIITGAGPGAVCGPHVRGWDVDGNVASAIPEVSFLAYGTNKYGVNVSSGDIDGDGIDEIVTGAGPGQIYGAHVRGWNFDGNALVPISGISFFAWAPTESEYGVKVFAGDDLDGDDRDDMVIGCGPDPTVGTPVKVYRYDGGNVSEWFDLQAFEGMNYGTNVAAGRF